MSQVGFMNNKNLRPIVEDVDTYSSFYTLDTVEIISSGMRQVQLFLDEKMSIPRTNWWWQGTVHIFSFHGFLLFLFLTKFMNQWFSSIVLGILALAKGR